MFKNMSEDQKNLYGCIDFLVSINIITHQTLYKLLSDLELRGLFDSFFNLGFFKASGIRSFKLANFLDGNYGNCYNDTIIKLRNNEISELRNIERVNKIYEHLVHQNEDLKMVLLKHKNELDGIY